VFIYVSEDNNVVGLLVLPFLLQNCVRDIKPAIELDTPKPKRSKRCVGVNQLKNKISPVLASKKLIVFSPVS